MGFRGLPRGVRLLLAALILLTPICIGLFIYLHAADERTTALAPVKLPFAAGAVLTAMGEHVLVSDDTFLYAYSRTGEKLWEYSLESSPPNVYATSKTLALWSSQSMHILGDDGLLIFRGTLPENITAVRCGEAMYAGLTGDNVIYVFDAEGRTIDTIPQAAEAVMDFGFYSQGDLLWVLSLENSGTAPVSHVSTYQPSRSMTSGNKFTDQVVYRALFHKNEMALVGTRQLLLNGDGGAADKFTDVLVYGWELLDGRVARDKLSLLFAPASQIESGRVTDARFYYGREKKDWVDYTLPPSSFTAVVGERAIYAIAHNSLTALPYTGEPRTYTLDSPIDAVITTLTGDGIIFSRGDEAYALMLP